MHEVTDLDDGKLSRKPPRFDVDTDGGEPIPQRRHMSLHVAHDGDQRRMRARYRRPGSH